MVKAPRGALLVLVGSLLAAGCAPSAGAEANVAASPSAGGSGAPSPSSTATVQRTADAQALLDGEYERTLQLANEAIRAKPSDPWPYYNRACAYIGLGKTKEALAGFKEAETHFGSDEYGKAICSYGRARALSAAGRCDEANQSFRAFGDLVGTVNPPMAEMALGYAGDCVAGVKTSPDPKGPAGGPAAPKPPAAAGPAAPPPAPSAAPAAPKP
jgi:tetratricopeptide (TPR) repeat protein